MIGPVLVYALGFGFAALGIALAMNLWRLFKGPGVADRILALDTMVINAIGIIVLAGIANGQATAFEAAMLLAMVGFVGTVAYCKFLLRGDIIE
ncbi:K+/H+ antiporter subunit F [Erythrobacter dokdonensis]|jgi:multicomponent K+:H+ antiporter subunit F|uniref:Putative K(+)/H(+) antiporter subunit F n=1 Tax=Erythrobacter dokdonensis DSW-74 TaxID=1300349 RepID=A0A1A7BDN2_9SPHN|nr:K+/H+ antiporter subunit F [Erythrobacter dokdonensis]MEE4316124.1 K+/H+ antiporter subunit F [Erythrobacter sp.]OBV10599.1 putative K(+)/H(+) antiporter subunit F [Erythrobacter dokdonensis DSW-74]